jgi:hypothetical protein
MSERGLNMVLRHVMVHLSCLYEPGPELHSMGRYRIVDSYSAQSFGNAGVTLESEVLRISVDLDRSHIGYTLMSTDEQERDVEPTIDIVVRLLTGDPGYDWETERFAAFICENLDEIEALFAPENLPATKAEVERLQWIRAKELFGI